MKPSFEIVPVIHPLLPIRTRIATNLHIDVTACAHAHRDVELLYVQKGEMTFFFGGDSVKVYEGDIIFVNSMVVHSTKDLTQKETQFFILQFDPAEVYSSDLFSEYKYLMAFLTDHTTPYYLFPSAGRKQNAEIVEILDEIRIETQNRRPAYELYIKSSLYKLWGILYRRGILSFDSSEMPNQKNILLERLSKLFAYVEKSYADEITVDTACRLLNLNYHYFCRVFKAATGRSFIQYVNFVRISEAEKLLLNTTQPIKSIVSQTGFSSMSYFNRAFKSIKGCSPSQYRLQSEAKL